MFTKLIIFITLLLVSISSFSEPVNGDVREKDGELHVWQTTVITWISPEAFFQIELRRLNEPTYGAVRAHPPYDSVKEWGALIDVLPDSRTCSMGVFHGRWRRLPDVLALEERLRNFGGCRDVFSF